MASASKILHFYAPPPTTFPTTTTTTTTMHSMSSAVPSATSSNDGGVASVAAPRAQPRSQSVEDLLGRRGGEDSESNSSNGDLEEAQTMFPETHSTKELQELCFSDNFDLNEVNPNYCGTATSSGHDDEFSLRSLQALSRDSRASLMELTVSRVGRELQRWGHVGTDDSAAPNCRLTTGCIPILNDGRILLISSSKSTTKFVLPKGGFELDESLGLSALRETLEEAGVTGILGPPLPALTYETRKAARSRLAKEQSTVSGNKNVDTTSSSPTSDKLFSGQHTHNRMTLFPLYVQEVYDTWPEQNRLRRAVTIQQALRLLKHRPEFVEILSTFEERQLLNNKVPK